jgi:hypothetical protein
MITGLAALLVTGSLGGIALADHPHDDYYRNRGYNYGARGFYRPYYRPRVHFYGPRWGWGYPYGSYPYGYPYAYPGPYGRWNW